MAKQTIKKIGDIERVIELGRNKKSSDAPYTINDTVPNIGGTPMEKKEREIELARNTYTKQKPYDINSLD